MRGYSKKQIFHVLKNANSFRRFASQSSTWRSTIGLEIHAQIASNVKLFSGAPVCFGAGANENVNLFDAAIPGTLPVLNKKCVESAVLSSLALSCNVNAVSYFDRKHYFYSDLPSGYQITQQRTPIATDGLLEFHVFTPGTHKEPYRKKCRLKQIQIEQDSGKSMHDEANGCSFIDLNRAGVALMEFVFEPDLQDGEEAAALVKELILILQRLGVCSCKMEEGALRVDANVSITDHPDQLGVRTETKNIGSIRGVANAITYEIQRQLKLVSSGKPVENETRGWDSVQKKTVSMRDKKEEHDYRFMPEPNLPPLRVCVDKTVERVRAGVLDLRFLAEKVPELPEATRKTLMEKFEFSDVYAIMLVNQPMLLEDFYKIIGHGSRTPKLVWKVLIVQLLNVLNNNGLDAGDRPINVETLGEIVDLLEEGMIDFETGRDIMESKIKGSTESATELVKQNNWQLVSDAETIESLCLQVIERNPKTVKKAVKGKSRSLQTLVNDVSSVTDRRINLSLVAKRLKSLLSEK